MHLHQKLLIGFFTFTSICFWGSKFGQIRSLPLSYELTWDMRERVKTPIFCNRRHYDRSQFMDIFALHDAAFNPRVKKLNILMHGHVPLSFCQAQEIVEIIKNFRQHKKQVHIWADDIDTVAKFLVFSACDKRYLKSVETSVAITGFGIVQEFKKELLEKKKIDVVAGQGCEYKGGLAPLLSSGFDYYAAANRRAFLEDLAQQARFSIADLLDTRCINVEQWFQIGYFSAHDAICAGLADGIKDYEEASNTVDLHEYVLRLIRYSRHCENVVYVVNLDFPVFGYICDLMARTLNEMAYDKDVKVVLLLIDCPGGSSMQIDKINRALELLRKRGKYIIAVVDSFAASGGYIFTSAAHKVYSRPGSMIGSIGAYYSIEDYRRWYKKKGIEFDRIYTHHPKDYLDERKKEFYDKEVQRGQEAFKQTVRVRRKLTKAQVDDIGNGQWYSGLAAAKIGLVDSLDGYVGAFDLIDALFNHEFFACVFIPNEFIMRRWLRDL